MKRVVASLIGMALVAGTLSGCEGGFDVGAMFGGGQAAQEPGPAEAAMKKPRRKKPVKPAPGQKTAKGARPAKAAGAQAADASGAAPAPSATPVNAPALKPRAFLMRNVAYDAMRTRAMRLVYEGQTKKALATFQDAERARPADPAVKLWVAAIRQSAQKARESAKDGETDFNNASQQLRTPLVPGLTAPAAPAAGAPPTLPRPRAIANPGGGSAPKAPAVDPRMVF